MAQRQRHTLSARCDRKESKMELEQFDALTRKVIQSGSSRRRAMGALAVGLLGGGLSGLAGRLGLDETVAAKPKSKRRRDQKHGSLQPAGKHGKKHRNRRPPSLPQ